MGQTKHGELTEVLERIDVHLEMISDSLKDLAECVHMVSTERGGAYGVVRTVLWDDLTR